jgi:hypothetical protein
LQVAKPQQETTEMSLLELFRSVEDFCWEYSLMGQRKQLGVRIAPKWRFYLPYLPYPYDLCAKQGIVGTNNK